MQIEVVASESHYLDHLAPIYQELPPELCGGMHLPRLNVKRISPGNIALVAGWKDVVRLRGKCPMIYVEHGAGQAYLGDPASALAPGYSGAGGHAGVIGYIAPSPTVAARWQSAPSVAVGCPKMDWFHTLTSSPQPDVLCFVWHWDALMVSPEARTAFPHYAPKLREIVKKWRNDGWQVWAHCHPRWRGTLHDRLTDMGMFVVHSWRSVMMEASVMVCDNSSLAYEFASLDRHVISLNAPWYRRHINHGLRFWDHVPGPQVDSPDELFDLRLEERTVDSIVKRRDAVAHAYLACDGKASERAALWITELVGA